MPPSIMNALSDEIISVVPICSDSAFALDWKQAELQLAVTLFPSELDNLSGRQNLLTVLLLATWERYNDDL